MRKVESCIILFLLSPVFVFAFSDAPKGLWTWIGIAGSVGLLLFVMAMMYRDIRSDNGERKSRKLIGYKKRKNDGISNFFMGNEQLNKGNPQMALFLYLRELEDVTNLAILSSIVYNIGVVFDNIGKLNFAEMCYLFSVSLLHEHGKNSGKSIKNAIKDNYNNLASLYNDLGEYELSQLYLDIRDGISEDSIIQHYDFMLSQDFLEEFIVLTEGMKLYKSEEIEFEELYEIDRVLSKFDPEGHGYIAVVSHYNLAVHYAKSRNVLIVDHLPILKTELEAMQRDYPKCNEMLASLNDLMLLTSLETVCSSIKLTDISDGQEVKESGNLFIEMSSEQAFPWFYRSAKNGDSNAQFMLGYLYLLGKGVERDIHSAKIWLTKAANQGDSDA